MDDAGLKGTVQSEDALRGLYRTPGEVAAKKVLSRLDKQGLHRSIAVPLHCDSGC